MIVKVAKMRDTDPVTCLSQNGPIWNLKRKILEHFLDLQNSSYQVCDGVGDVNGGLFAGHPLQLRARHGSVGVTQQHLEALHHGLGDGGTQIASLERQNDLNNKIMIQFWRWSIGDLTDLIIS